LPSWEDLDLVSDSDAPTSHPYGYTVKCDEPVSMGLEPALAVRGREGAVDGLTKGDFGETHRSVEVRREFRVEKVQGDSVSVPRCGRAEAPQPLLREAVDQGGLLGGAELWNHTGKGTVVLIFPRQRP
ncbi:hypothetical protein, partial [Rathayibacter tanaceti]|uniref:hypothetical protein n=1 Tax=Rathayibacter tanaceti TaxID=1671680 RepID=UPI001A7E09CA